MRRLWWLLLGGAVGFVAVRRLAGSSVADGPPDGDRPAASAGAPAGALSERFADLWTEVQTFAAEREVELREAVGLDGRHDVVDAPPATEQIREPADGVGDNR